MKKATLFAGALAVLATCLLTSLAGAVPFDNKPKLLLHLKGTTTKNQCTSWGSLADCTTAATEGLSGATPTYYYLYLLVARGNVNNIAGIQCGLTYQNGLAGNDGDQAGIDVFGWTLCATLEFATPGANAWPKPGGGNLITWDSINKCQTGETGVAGYFYMGAYGPDTFRLTLRPVDNAAKVANCASVETILTADDLGFVAFSADASTAGCNPCNALCGGVPVEQTTWGAIKSLY